MKPDENRCLCFCELAANGPCQTDQAGAEQSQAAGLRNRAVADELLRSVAGLGSKRRVEDQSAVRAVGSGSRQSQIGCVRNRATVLKPELFCALVENSPHTAHCACRVVRVPANMLL